MNTKSISFKGNYIQGEWLRPTATDGEWTISSPANLKDIVISCQFQNNHAEKAIEAAQKAFLPWAELSLDERKKYLLQLKNAFVRRAAEIAEVIARETGKPLWETQVEAAGLANKIDITLEHSLKLIADEKIPNALPNIPGVIRFKPRGVMAVIGPFNFPAHLPNGHIVPALIAGNTVVFKPSEKTPATAQLYTECIEEAGLPPGVFNLVQGQTEVGKKLSQSGKVDGVLFTGSYDVGLKIKQDTLEHYWKILALEMGGKNTTIVWDDADIDKAIYETLTGAFLSTGQRCSATSKLVLHKKIADSFLGRFHAAAKKLVIGHWSQPVFMGPLIDQSALEKYLRFQDIAAREGASCVMRGKALQLEHPGYYVTPSIYQIDKVRPDSLYQKSEIFGPNVAVYITEDFGDALDYLNMSGYGLAAALFSKNEQLYKSALLKARVGILNWNRTTNGASSRLPFGGINKSGNDRPSAHFAIQYCAVPVASLEDTTTLAQAKIFPGVTLT